MFTNRVFNIAFIVSLAWHLGCMSAVNVVVLPGKYKTRDLTSVSFLGPILETTALDIMLANKPVALTTSYRHTLRSRETFDDKRALALEGEGRGYITSSDENAADVFRKVFQRNKEIPDMMRLAEHRNTASAVIGEKGISGPVSKREVIHRPDKPELPPYVDTGGPFTVELEFTVSHQGDVEEVVPVVSSGSLDADLLGIRYIKSWKFAPLSRGFGRKQKGRIKFVFGGENSETGSREQ